MQIDKFAFLKLAICNFECFGIFGIGDRSAFKDAAFERGFGQARVFESTLMKCAAVEVGTLQINAVKYRAIKNAGFPLCVAAVDAVNAHRSDIISVKTRRFEREAGGFFEQVTDDGFVRSLDSFRKVFSLLVHIDSTQNENSLKHIYLIII